MRKEKGKAKEMERKRKRRIDRRRGEDRGDRYKKEGQRR
jgi:hypothetical protein